MQCIELVIQDHVILRRGLDILEGMIKELEVGERIEIADVTSILKFFRVFGYQYHQTTEEKSLFPPLLRDTSPESSLHLMWSEHGEVQAMTAAVEDALRSKRAGDFMRNSSRLTHFFRTHLDQEDVILRDIAERSLSKEDDSSIAAEFMKNHQAPEIFADFSRLERKYTQKVPRTPLSSERPLAHA